MIEAAPDTRGEVVPSVPVISVVPADASRLWHVLAVLLAPPVTAWAVRQWGGTALVASAVKLGRHRCDWFRCRRRGERGTPPRRCFATVGTSCEAGPLMCGAYGSSKEVHAWWKDRLR